MTLRSLLPIGRESAPARRESSPFGTLQREIDRLFDDFSRGFAGSGNGWSTQALVPSMDVTETDKQIEITAELPGLEEKDVKVNVADGVLTISGEKKAEKEEKDKNYRMVERSYGAFSRTLELPDGVDPNAIKAALTKGVLKVSIPKPAPAQVKNVEIKTAA